MFFLYLHRIGLYWIGVKWTKVYCRSWSLAPPRQPLFLFRLARYDLLPLSGEPNTRCAYPCTWNLDAVPAPKSKATAITDGPSVARRSQFHSILLFSYLSLWPARSIARLANLSTQFSLPIQSNPFHSILFSSKPSEQHLQQSTKRTQLSTGRSSTSACPTGIHVIQRTRNRHLAFRRATLSSPRELILIF